MNTINKVATFALFALTIAMPFAHAKDQGAKECVISAAQWGGNFVADPNSAEAIIFGGGKPLFDSFEVYSDAGWFGSTFAVFELPQFKNPVLFGRLRIQLNNTSVIWEPPPYDQMAITLWDIIDISLLLQPLWTFEEYETSKSDAESGRLYGKFGVGLSPTDDGRIFEVPLSYDAMFDINAAAGGMFGIGIANGEGWVGEGEYVVFRDPDAGGVIQLVIPNCRTK